MMIGGDKESSTGSTRSSRRWRRASATSRARRGREGRDPRVEQGYIHAGPVGAGHFVKMVHNGIEYGLMQAYAEGFDILKTPTQALPEEHRFDLDIADIAEVWRRGSVISSWLLDLTASALAAQRDARSYSGYVEDSGEGRWTVNAAIDEAVPAEVLTAALYAVSARASTIRSPRKSFRRCARALAATRSRRRNRSKGGAPMAVGKQARRNPSHAASSFSASPATSPPAGDPCPL